MKNQYPTFIYITKKFNFVLDDFSKQLFNALTESIPTSEPELRKLITQILESILFPAELSTATIRYLEPKLQLTKSGPLGKNSYVRTNARQDYARRLPEKPYQPTPARIQQQTRMKLAVAAWQSTGDSIRNQWNKAATEFQLAGVHLYRGVYICLLIDNLPIPDPFIPTPELLQYYRSR
ncbi:MAG: hypothetical protein N3A72_10100 [bacterium]|nr:hypothetical protein [bacterium]